MRMIAIIGISFCECGGWGEIPVVTLHRTVIEQGKKFSNGEKHTKTFRLL